MISVDTIGKYFPPQIRDNPVLRKYMIKEYLLLLILDFLSTTRYIRKLVFIGGTNLRLVKGIDRFSEDLYFDCSGFSKDEFDDMAGSVLQFLKRSGFNAEIKPGDERKLSAWRCNIFFPGFLFELGLTGHREERFLIKIETEDQQLDYSPVIANIRRAGFFFPVPVPSDDVLCSMKISAMLTRMKGRDFYDVIFLLGFTVPNYKILSRRFGINNLVEMKQHVNNMLKSVDLSKKRRDFEHLLFNPGNSSRILRFAGFIDEL